MTSPTAVIVTIAQVCDALETVLSAATGLGVHHTYDELTESMPDRAMLQVYPEESGETDVMTGNDRLTSQRGVAITEWTFFADVYAQQRAHIGEDMGALVPLIDAIITELEKQKVGPLFNLTVSNIQVIKAFKFSWRRVVFEYGEVKYIGARFTIRIKIY